MEERAVLNVAEEKKMRVPSKNTILVQASKSVKYFPALQGKPISWCCAGDILSEKRKWENETCESLKCLINPFSG
jgi:hypothetical protein